MQTLSSTERDRLRVLHKQERDSRVCDRIKAVLLNDKGWSVAAIAEALLIQPSTITTLKSYEKEGKLAPENRGSVSKLNAIQTTELLSHLEEITYTKVSAICQYIKIRYGVIYSTSGLTDWLQSHNFTYKTCVGADKKKQEAFIKTYKKLEKELPSDEQIVFMDSAHPTQATKLGYGWIKKGTAKQIKTTASVAV